MLDLNWSINPQRPFYPGVQGKQWFKHGQPQRWNGCRLASEIRILEGSGRGAYENLEKQPWVPKNVFFFCDAAHFFKINLERDSETQLDTLEAKKKSILTIYTSRDLQYFCWKKNPQLSLLHQLFVGWCVAPIFGRQMNWWLTLLFIRVGVAPQRSRWIPPKKIGNLL